MAILLFESTNEYSNCFVLHVDILHSNRLRSRGRVIRLGPRSQVSNRISTCSPRPPETPKLHLIGPTSLQLRFLCINFQNFSYSFKVTHLAWSCVKSMHSSCTKTVSNQSGFCRGLSTHSPVSCRANVKRVWNGHRKTDWLVRKPFNIPSTVMPWCRPECLQGSPDLSKAEMPVKGDLWDVFLRCRDMSSHWASRCTDTSNPSLHLFVSFCLSSMDLDIWMSWQPAASNWVLWCSLCISFRSISCLTFFQVLHRWRVPLQSHVLGESFERQTHFHTVFPRKLGNVYSSIQPPILFVSWL